MITNIITKMLGCTVVRAAVESLSATREMDTVIMKVVENTVKAYGINCRTWHTDEGMQFVAGSDESVEITIRISDAAKMVIVSEALDTIKESGINKEKIQKALLQAVLEQIKK